MWLLLLLLTSVQSLHTREPPAPAPLTRSAPQERWLDVRLNHFDASDTRNFRMRYYYNDEFTSQHSNIVIFVGGEWEISPGWTQTGLAYELASRTGSGLFYTEHRYYGSTRPTRDTQLTNLRFLNVDQALGDLAQFIEHVKSDDYEGGKFKNATVGLVGCSYAGSMATWMRLSYPHLVDAAFSDSGPLYAQEDFPEYLEVITEALRSQGSEACLTSVGEAIQRMVDLLGTDDGAAQVSTMFNTCAPLRANATLDITTFFWYGITETFAYLVQYATPGDITSACDVITDSAVADPMQRLANWITKEPWTQPCIEPRYEEVVRKHKNVSYDAPDTTMRLWTYQTCVEYGWYQTTTSSHQPFLSTVPLEYFHQMCKDFFSVDINESLLRAGIHRTNLFFGGFNIPDRVVSVAGGIDPWSPMGPNATHSRPHAPVYFVPEISHCRAITPTNDSETEILRDAKLSVLRYMELHMTGDSVQSAAHSVGITPLIVVFSISLWLL
ncbi:unnamed protein product [Colias eurytheme]|nr:unnamed protein product [Colias eurytheme]